MAEQTGTQIAARLLRTVPDFPEPGILFRDLTPVFADPVGFAAVVDELVGRFGGGFDLVAGIEARGFLLAAAAAYAARTGVVVVRKAGKLPGPVLHESYALEYGRAELQLGEGIVPPGSRVLILDDVLATGGTASAVVRLIERAGGVVVGLGVVMELCALGGRERMAGLPVVALLRE